MIRKIIKEELNKFIKFQDRYKIVNGYKFDRLFFKFFMFSIFIILIGTAWSYDFELDYYNCPVGGNIEVGFGQTVNMCENPFYSESWKNQEYLMPGEYGHDPTNTLNLLWLITIIGIILTLVVNHFVHNKNKKIGELFK